jgi:NADP-dependent aldehyde dehydrogenase
MTDTTTVPAETSTGELDAILDQAVQAAGPWGTLTPTERAGRLRAVADALDAAGPELIPLAQAESHLLEARLTGELGRTTAQLRLFAGELDQGAYLGVTIDHADTDWPAGGRADLRRLLVPLGPTVVFGASNFPFAFSTAGGDTASALAAGCPVVHKAHPGHLRLAAATAAVVVKALELPGVFALIVGDEAGRAALTDPRVQAGAFTGSLAGGRALFDLATSRPVPIPFYGELGSINPVFVTKAAAASRLGEIVSGYAGSFTLGAGQFCTKPGLLFVPEESYDEAALTDAVGPKAAAPLLNDRITAGFSAGLGRLEANPAIRVVARGTDGASGPTPTLLATSLRELLEHRDDLLVECFGPTSIVVTYRDEDDLLDAAAAFDGQLTATIHGEADDTIAPQLLDALKARVGRVLWNGWPTGVAVTYAMEHGGPYPATTAPGTTSVGTAAIERFLRPVTYQSVPDALLPPALQEANPLGIPRRVDGRIQLP